MATRSDTIKLRKHLLSNKLGDMFEQSLTMDETLARFAARGIPHRQLSRRRIRLTPAITYYLARGEVHDTSDPAQKVIHIAGRYAIGMLREEGRL